MNVANNNKGKDTTPIAARSAFVPRFGYKWYCFDYNSQEIWICADGSGDQVMLKTLFSGGSMHTETAIAFFGKEAIEKEMKSQGAQVLRIKAKLTNFGMIYGIGPRGLAELLKTSITEAQELLDKYRLKYPETMTFFDRMSALCSQQGYITTAFGRKIWMEYDWGYRACNYYVQGTAADVMKEAMLKVDTYLKANKIPGSIILTIHDEMILELSNECKPNVIADVKKLMEEHPQLTRVKRIPVEISVVNSCWDKKEKLKI
jgi:DNA polymerase-1